MKRYAVLLSLVLAFSTTAWGYHISDVTVSPLNPTTQTPVTITVTGNAPATNYHLDHSNLWQLGAMFFLDIYWTSTDNGGMVLVPYTHQKSLGTLAAGKYLVCVRSFCDGLVRESKNVSFTVTRVIVNPPTWPGLFWYSLFWTSSNGSSFTSTIQIQGTLVTLSNSTGVGF
jgi:hypothetical protein